MAINSRAIAAKILGSLLKEQGSLSNQLDPFRHETEFQFIQELCFGTCRWFHQLDFLLQELLSKPLKPKDRDVRALMLIGLYQLKFMRVPDHAAINETVSATSDLKQRWARGLVNAVLRNFQRQADTLQARLDQASLASRASHPDWLVEAVATAWPDQLEDILDAGNARPPLTLRVNLVRQSREQYLQKLSSLEIKATPGLLADSAIYLSEPIPVHEIPGFAEGEVSVQDEASQLVAGTLRLEPGLLLLDACAAPGGKTSSILESERSLTQLVAIDKDKSRLSRIEENLQRLQLEAELVCADAAILESWWDGEAFDRVLLDAPCSATGVIRRHPDIKLLRTPGQITALLATQQQLLHQLWQCLKSGGLLLYTTCSILPEENQAQIQQFLDSHNDAKYEGIAADWGVECESGRQLLPSTRSGTDGFFFSLLRKC